MKDLFDAHHFPYALRRASPSCPPSPSLRRRVCSWHPPPRRPHPAMPRALPHSRGPARGAASGPTGRPSAGTGPSGPGRARVPWRPGRRPRQPRGRDPYVYGAAGPDAFDCSASPSTSTPSSASRCRTRRGTGRDPTRSATRSPVTWCSSPAGAGSATSRSTPATLIWHAPHTGPSSAWSRSGPAACSTAGSADRGQTAGRLRQDSNLRHLVPETSALSPELRRPCAGPGWVLGAGWTLPGDIRARETWARRYPCPVNPEQLSATIVDGLSALVDQGELTLPDGVPTEVTVERPRQKGHGDYATNVALQLAKKARARTRGVRRAARRQAAGVRRHRRGRGRRAGLPQHHRRGRRAGPGGGRHRRSRSVVRLIERVRRRADQPGVRVGQPDRAPPPRRRALGSRG